MLVRVDQAGDDEPPRQVEYRCAVAPLCGDLVVRSYQHDLGAVRHDRHRWPGRLAGPVDECRSPVDRDRSAVGLGKRRRSSLVHALHLKLVLKTR